MCSRLGSSVSSAPISGLTKENLFNVGSFVSLQLRNSCSPLKGEVLAHDPATRFLILKIPSIKGHSQSDIHMINLSLVMDFHILTDPTNSSNGSAKDYLPPLPNLNVQKLENRLKDSVEKKKRLIMGYKDGVSIEGQTLFRAICKTLDEVVWEGDNICIMNMVTISPPYMPENVKGTKNMKAFNHVKKIVEKHVYDEALHLKKENHKKYTNMKDCLNGSSCQESKNIFCNNN
ncbi:protein LSM12 homolog A [Lepeophtheirus salmonis]|uniref:protein LSM12 homolog A n=1 Tax=Lepeophtheirus salmonis TaxID=72036 RepID=UPI00077F6681|nr:protein LSM12 homolog A-like isoform X1 [Lepeophtheirus salmonis]